MMSKQVPCFPPTKMLMLQHWLRVLMGLFVEDPVKQEACSTRRAGHYFGPNPQHSNLGS